MVHTVATDRPPTVVVFHGMPGSGVYVEEATAIASELGVGLLSVNRPGYAGSDTAAPGLGSAVSDVLATADAFGMDRFAVLGVSGGGPFAAAAAVAARDRVSALGIAAGVGDWREADPDRASWDEADFAAFEMAEAGDLTGAGEVIRRGCEDQLASLLTLDDDSLTASIIPPSESSPGLLPNFVREFRDSLQSFDGLVYDNLTLFLPWGFAPSQIEQPTWLWYGDTDPVVPLNHGRWYEASVPHATFVLRSGEGHGPVIRGHWREMLETLAAPNA